MKNIIQNGGLYIPLDNVKSCTTNCQGHETNCAPRCVNKLGILDNHTINKLFEISNFGAGVKLDLITEIISKSLKQQIRPMRFDDLNWIEEYPAIINDIPEDHAILILANEKQPDDTILLGHYF